MITNKILTLLTLFIALLAGAFGALLYTGAVKTNPYALSHSADVAAMHDGPSAPELYASSRYAPGLDAESVDAPDCLMESSNQTTAPVYIAPSAIAPVSPKPSALAPTTRARTSDNTNDDSNDDSCEDGLGAPGCPKTAADRTGPVIRTTNGVVTGVAANRTAPAAVANAHTYDDPCENGLGAPGCPKTAADRTGTVIQVN